jgi:hypothetical protein
MSVSKLPNRVGQAFSTGARWGRGPNDAHYRSLGILMTKAGPLLNPFDWHNSDGNE